MAKIPAKQLVACKSGYSINLEGKLFALPSKIGVKTDIFD